MTKSKVVVIGGGTGTFTVLSGLKKHPLDLTAIVSVADSGGSTGRLRDEFGYLPVGDFRMALAALADAEEEPENLLRELFLYRFDRGGRGLRGHNFGNLLLIAMTDILGAEEKAFEFASKVLRVRGEVLPITLSDIELYAQYNDGRVVKGETNIDIPKEGRDGTLGIKRLWIEPEAKISVRAKNAIGNADLIILGPGDLYTSLLANIVVKGVSESIRNSKAKLVYISNLMTKYGQTYGFSASDHVREIKKYVGVYPDFVFINTYPLPKNILRKYEEENDFPVKDDLTDESCYVVIRDDLVAVNEIEKLPSDKVRRSLIRHDSDKLANKVLEILSN